MRFELPYPPPDNVLVKHPKLGVCFFERKVCRIALTGMEVDSHRVNVKKGWMLYVPPMGKRTMFYVFNVTTAKGINRVGASAENESDAVRKLRAKLGLPGDIKIEKIDELVDAATCTFEQFQAASVKRGGNDSDEALQQNIPRSEQTSEGFRPVASETDPGETVLPPESEPDGTRPS